MSYSHDPKDGPSMGCGSTCRKEDDTSKIYCLRKTERMNANALKEEK